MEKARPHNKVNPLLSTLFSRGQLYYEPKTDTSCTSKCDKILQHLTLGFNILYTKHYRQEALHQFIRAYHLATSEGIQSLIKFSLLSIQAYFSREPYTTNHNYQRYLEEYRRLAERPIEKAWVLYYESEHSMRDVNSSAVQQESKLVKAKELLDSIQSRSHLVYLVNSLLAIVWHRQGLLDQAEKAQKHIIRKCEDIPYLKYLCFRSQYQLGLISIDRNRLDQAMTYASKLPHFQDKRDSIRSASSIHRIRYLIHKKSGNFESALVEHEKLRLAQRQMNIRDNVALSSALETKLRTRKAERDLREQKLRNNRKNAIFIAALSLLAFLLSFSYYKLNFARSESLRNAAENRIIKQQSEIQAINAQLDGQESERRSLSMHLHDSVVGNMVAANMHMRIAAQDPQGEALEKSRVLVKQASEQIRDLSHSLYPPILLKLGIGPAVLDLCDKYSSDKLQFLCNAEANNIRLKGDGPTKIYYVIQELLNNAVKHSQASFCQVSMLEIDDNLEIRVEDDGIGISTDAHQGLGMTTVQTRIKSLHGEYQLKSGENVGTTHMIRLPKTSLES